MHIPVRPVLQQLFCRRLDPAPDGLSGKIALTQGEGQANPAVTRVTLANLAEIKWVCVD